MFPSPPLTPPPLLSASSLPSHQSHGGSAGTRRSRAHSRARSLLFSLAPELRAEGRRAKSARRGAPPPPLEPELRVAACCCFPLESKAKRRNSVFLVRRRDECADSGCQNRLWRAVLNQAEPPEWSPGEISWRSPLWLWSKFCFFFFISYWRFCLIHYSSELWKHIVNLRGT